MSVVPPEIPGIGSTAQKLRVAPGFDPLKSGIGPEEYFVFSRIDGASSIKDIIVATGLPPERGIACVKKLRSIGAVLLPGETAPPAQVPAVALPPLKPVIPPGVGRAPTPTAASRIPAPLPIKRELDTGLPNATADEVGALAEVNDLPEATRRKVLTILRLVDRDPREMLGVPVTGDARALKHAYFALSKEIHPDRFYGKKLGSFAQRLPMAFESLSRAYAKATNTEAPRTVSQQRVAEQPQTPAEYAAELFDRGCTVEVGGDHVEAMKLFAAAVRIEPQIRYLRRAAICAIQAQQPKTALEYAKKAQQAAPEDPSAARLLATAFRANGKLEDAEDVLLAAMLLKTENDVLSNEMRNDLAEVRRQLADK